MIAVVDYGRGNLFSLGQALQHLGAEWCATDDGRVIAEAGRIIVPGVGAFGDAMSALRSHRLIEPVRQAAAGGIPILGICLGMQMLADASEEFGHHEGLGLIPGVVRRLPEGGEIRVPNVGWRELFPAPAGNGFLDGITAGTMTYFVHSYAQEPANPSDLAATIDVNGRQVAAIVKRGPVVGYQFHPEKSGPAGLDLLRRFLDLV